VVEVAARRVGVPVRLVLGVVEPVGPDHERLAGVRQGLEPEIRLLDEAVDREPVEHDDQRIPLALAEPGRHLEIDRAIAAERERPVARVVGATRGQDHQDEECVT
jgi:hypothetical protein